MYFVCCIYFTKRKLLCVSLPLAMVVSFLTSFFLVFKKWVSLSMVIYLFMSSFFPFFLWRRLRRTSWCTTSYKKETPNLQLGRIPQPIICKGQDELLCRTNDWVWTGHACKQHQEQVVKTAPSFPLSPSNSLSHPLFTRNFFLMAFFLIPLSKIPHCSLRAYKTWKKNHNGHWL